jgi:hypothetical protein
MATNASGAPKDVMGMLNYYLATKAPYQIPTRGREWIVKYSPWINLVLLVLFAPAILLVLGLGVATLPFSVGAPAAAGGLGLAMIALIIQVVLMVVALPGLFARKASGWNFLFYSAVLNLVYNLLSLQIVLGIVNAVISLYILFQIKNYYK